ncbi:MAG: hypothetical protein IRZ04_06150, partial [Rhodospirillales bacterium]|nr:hypothetical protein [Rhodospirillales bacterium]
DLLRKEGVAARSTVQSFDWRTLKHVQILAPEIETSCLTRERGRSGNLEPAQKGASPWLAGLDVDAFDGSVPRLVAAAGCRVWSPFFREVSKEALDEAKRLGLGVVVWTVNDPADMEPLIEMGVDGIITDYPDRLRKVAGARGIPLPDRLRSRHSSGPPRRQTSRNPLPEAPFFSRGETACGTSFAVLQS